MRGQEPVPSTVDHIPVISVGHEGASPALWMPPLGMTKEDVRPVLELLAGAGFHAISFDPWQHGERRSESADEIRARVFSNFRRHMWPIIGQTTLDCLRVIDHFGGGPVVAGGTSMGGDAAIALAGIDRGPDDHHVPPDGAQRFAAALGGEVRVNVRTGLGHIDVGSSAELVDSCVAWLRG